MHARVWRMGFIEAKFNLLNAQKILPLNFTYLLF
jgi:hypothetical protein